VHVRCRSERPLTRGHRQLAREGFPIYFGENLYAAKWRNYKLHFVWQVHTFDAVSTLGVPRIFNLLTNPQENPDENLVTTHLWVLKAASKLLSEFQASLKHTRPSRRAPPTPTFRPNQPCRRRRGRDHRPGRPGSAVGASTPRTVAPRSTTTCWASSHIASTPITTGTTQVRMQSPTTAAGARAVTSRSITTARKSARAASTNPRLHLLRRRDNGCGQRIRHHRQPDDTAHTSRGNGKINWVQIDLGEDV